MEYFFEISFTGNENEMNGGSGAEMMVAVEKVNVPTVNLSNFGL